MTILHYRTIVLSCSDTASTNIRFSFHKNIHQLCFRQQATTILLLKVSQRDFRKTCITNMFRKTSNIFHGYAKFTNEGLL